MGTIVGTMVGTMRGTMVGTVVGGLDHGGHYGGWPELDSSPTSLLLIHKLIPSHTLPAQNWPNFKMETISRWN